MHIIEETVLAAQRLNPEGAWMLSTHGTRASGLYQKYADKHGYTLYLPNEEQAEKAQQAIFYVKAGELDRAGAVTKALVEELWRERDLPGDDGLYRAAVRIRGFRPAAGQRGFQYRGSGRCLHQDAV